MKRLALLAPLALAGCAQLPLDMVLGLAPTPAEICALSPASQAALAAQLQTEVANLTAACEIIN